MEGAARSRQVPDQHASHAGRSSADGQLRAQLDHWSRGRSTEFDKNLETHCRQDEATWPDPPLEISQILHIAASNAPKVIARFGTLINLVTQVLEPVIDAWFRNAAQQRLAIEFIENRQSIQDSAADYIRNELAKYDVEGVATLIGDTPPPEKLATPRQEKQVAEQQKEMYAVQRDAQAVREQTEEQRALADTKARVVSAQRDVTVAEQEARAAVARAEGEAGAIRKIAEATAARETLVGMAQAGVLEAKVSAIGRDNWTTMDVITHLAEQHVPIVPQVVAGGGDGVGGGNVAGALLGVLAARMLRPEHRLCRLRRRPDRILFDGKRETRHGSRDIARVCPAENDPL